MTITGREQGAEGKQSKIPVQLGGAGLSVPNVLSLQRTDRGIYLLCQEGQDRDTGENRPNTGPSHKTGYIRNGAQKGTHCEWLGTLGLKTVVIYFD